MIEHAIHELGLPKGKRVICAVSGGVDSMVLLDLLIQHGFDVVVAHVNHQLRKESAQEALWLTEKCQKRHIPIEVRRINLDLSKNIHHQGHWKRLQFYAELSKQFETSIVLLGHHLNDQLETFLMRVIRGDSPHAWAGMRKIQPLGNLTLMRPFINIPKTTITTYAHTHQVDHIEDSSNQEIKYFRNQIRHLLVPNIIDKNPRFLTDFPQLISLFRKAFQIKFNIYQNHHFFYVDSRFYDQQPVHHQTFILQSLFQRTVPRGYLSDKHIRMIQTRLKKDASHVQFEIHGNIAILRQYQMLGCYRLDVKPPQPVTFYTFGEFSLTDGSSVILSPEKLRRPYKNVLELCYNKITFPITIRGPKQGDLMQFSYGHKKIQRLLIDEKILKPLRSFMKIVETVEGIQGILSFSLSPQSSCPGEKIYIYEVANVA